MSKTTEISKTTKRFALNVLGTLTMKGLAIIVGMLTIPIYSKYFNNDDIYGVWLSMLSVLSWILLFDFGFGNGMRNKLISSIEEGNKERSSSLVSSTYFGTLLISVIVFVIGSILSFSINMNKVFGVSDSIVSRSQLSICMFVLVAAVSLQFFLRNVTFILHAKRHVALGSLFALISNSLLLVFAFAFQSMSFDKLLLLTIAYFFSINIPLLIGNGIVFLKDKYLFPRIKFFSKKTCKEVMSLGLKYFAIQLCTLVLWSFNPVLISSHPVFNSSTVVVYTKYYKIFSTIVSLVNVAATTVWVEAASAYKDKNFKKIARLFLFMLAIGIFLSLVSLIAGLLIQKIFNLWLGSSTIDAENLITIVFVLYSIIFIFAECMIVFSNGFEKLKSQLICSIIFAIIKIPFFYLYVLIVKDANSWIGTIIVNILYGIAMIISLFFELKTALKNINDDSNRLIPTMVKELKVFFSETKIGKMALKVLRFICCLLLALLVIFQTGHSYVKNSGNTTFVGALLILLIIMCFSFALAKFLKDRKLLFGDTKERKKTIIILTVWMIINTMFLLSFIFNKDKSNNIKSYFTNIAIYNCFVLFVYSIPFASFSKIYLKSLSIICVASLVMFVLVRFSRISFASFSFLYDKQIMDSYLYFYSDPSTSLASGVVYANGTRLMGPFWEPGVFATTLLVGLIIEIITCHKKAINWARILLYVFCLFLTNSTAGLMILPFVVLLFIDKITLDTQARKLTLIISFAATGLALFVVILFFGNKLFTQNASLVTREESLLYNLKVFITSPLFGVGFKTGNQLYYELIIADGKEALITANTSTIGILLSSFGIWTITYLLIPIVFIVLNKKISITGKVIMIMIFILMGFKENQFSLFATTSFFFYFVKDAISKDSCMYCVKQAVNKGSYYEIKI